MAEELESRILYSGAPVAWIEIPHTSVADIRQSASPVDFSTIDSFLDGAYQRKTEASQEYVILTSFENLSGEEIAYLENLIPKAGKLHGKSLDATIVNVELTLETPLAIYEFDLEVGEGVLVASDRFQMKAVSSMALNPAVSAFSESSTPSIGAVSYMEISRDMLPVEVKPPGDSSDLLKPFSDSGSSHVDRISDKIIPMIEEFVDGRTSSDPFSNRLLQECAP